MSRNSRLLLQTRRLHWLSAGLLILIFAAYFAARINCHMSSFVNPMAQNDDARIHVMPMHRYDGAGTLKDDPVANDMLAFSTLGFRLMYMLFTPFTDIFIATKLVQVIAYLTILAAVVIACMSRKAGLACGILMGFLLLHTDIVIRALGGGLQRGFIYPVAALWMAGAMGKKSSVRFAAAVLGSLTYPASMALVLAAEGIFMLRNGIRFRRPFFRKRMITYGAMVLVCFMITEIDLRTKPDAGKLPTLKEAKADPAFGPMGRSPKFPLRDPWDETRHCLTGVLGAEHGYAYVRPLQICFDMEETLPLFILAVFVVITTTRIAPAAPGAVALLCAAIFTHFLARAFAFRLLYIPYRYVGYGILPSVVLLVSSSVGFLWAKVRNRHRRAALRNFSATAAICAFLFMTGDHLDATSRAGMSIDGNILKPLWDYIALLPIDARIAAHPKDADGISFWTGRAATPGEEQLLPWLDKAWERNRTLAEDTLAALYATNRTDILSYCSRHHITHILRNARRYESDIPALAATFEPLTSCTAGLLANVQTNDLVLVSPIESATTFRYGDFEVLDVRLLDKAARAEKEDHAE